MLNSGDAKQYTAFHNACAGGRVEYVELLLGAGCDTALQNASGLTGSDLAASLRRKEVLTLLRSQHASPQIPAAAPQQSASELKKLKHALREAGYRPRATKPSCAHGWRRLMTSYSAVSLSLSYLVIIYYSTNTVICTQAA